MKSNMTFKYRYLPTKYVFVSFFLVFSSLIIAAIGVWFGLISNLVQRNVIGGWQVFITIFFAMSPSLYFNERVIKGGCAWDNILFNGEVFDSLRFGIIEIKNIKNIKINDLSNVYSFVIKTHDGRYKFSCLSFLGREGGSEYARDKESLKSMAETLLQLANSPKYSIAVGKESSSGVLFALSCVAMLMLIPGFIYAPQRMIFVVPFVIPLFFVLWKKRQSDKAKQNKSTKRIDK